MLPKQRDYRKIRCRYGVRNVKLYTFLCDSALADSLEPDDFVIVDSNEEFAIVQVVDETDAPLSETINYKHLLRKI
jgi:hypothetical protein